MGKCKDMGAMNTYGPCREDRGDGEWWVAFGGYINNIKENGFPTMRMNVILLLKY